MFDICADVEHLFIRAVSAYMLAQRHWDSEVALGGGIDVKASNMLYIRLVQADYYMARHEGEAMNNLVLAFGVVFCLGAK